MPLEIKRALTKKEFESFVAAKWEIHNSRPDSNWELFKGPTFEAYREREWEAYSMASNNTHIVVDNNTRKIVSGAQWCVYDKNPFEEVTNLLKEHPQVWDTALKEANLATWYEEGSDIRAMADQEESLYLIAKPKHMNRPHIFGTDYFVSPAYEQQGVGAMLLKQCCELADAIDHECMMGANDEERPAFEAAGFSVIDEWHVDPQTENPSKAWIELKENIFPEPYHTSVVWRPKKSNVMKGQTQYARVDPLPFLV